MKTEIVATFDDEDLLRIRDDCRMGGTLTMIELAIIRSALDELLERRRVARKNMEALSRMVARAREAGE